MIQKEPAPEWKNKDVVLCEPCGVSGAKKMKIIKRGFKSLIRDLVYLTALKSNVSTKIKRTDKTKRAKRENFCLTSFFKKAERTAIEKSSLFVSILNH